MTSRDCHVVPTKRQPLPPSSPALSRQFTQRTTARWLVSPIPATVGGASIHNSRAHTARRTPSSNGRRTRKANPREELSVPKSTPASDRASGSSRLSDPFPRTCGGVFQTPTHRASRPLRPCLPMDAGLPVARSSPTILDGPNVPIRTVSDRVDGKSLYRIEPRSLTLR
jgi:hypothetical protein